MKSAAEIASRKEHKVFYGFVLLLLIAGGGHYLWKNWDRLLVWPQKREALLQSLRDPSSAQFREERLRRTGYLCGQVNAKNGRIIDFDRELDDSKPADPSKYVSADAAKKAALDHAGLTEAQVTELKAELDTDSLTAHYDVEFKCGGFEYEYKINAKSGKVISFEKERD